MTTKVARHERVPIAAATSPRSATPPRWPTRSRSAGRTTGSEHGHLPRAEPDRCRWPTRTTRAPGAEKLFVLDMFPYPSGRRPARRAPAGLHRHRLLRPLPADGRPQRAARDGLRRVRPARRAVRGADRHSTRALTTEANVERYRAQLRRLGLAHDPRRSVATTDVDFYRWTQWIFLQIFNSWYDADRRNGPPDRRAGRRVRGGQPVHPGRPAVGRAVRRRSAAPSSTATGWPTSARRRSTGAPAWAPCWPTRRSPPTAAASAATSRSSSAT